MKYSPTWDLRTIPDPEFHSEAARRRSSRGGGRPRVMKTCDKCGAVMSAREKRAHKCPTKAQADELDTRVAQYRQNPEDVIPWERVKEALSSKKQKGGG